MRALIVFESVFGNTRRIAESIVDGLGPVMTTTVVAAAGPDVPAPDEFDLLVVGAPTHAWGLPTSSTRNAQRGPAEPVIGEGVREWLDRLPSARPGSVAATFDTRLARPRWLTGSAARRAAARLRGLGFRVVATEGFRVEGTRGPLSDGEIDRARAWGGRLAEQVGAVRG